MSLPHLTVRAIVLPAAIMGIVGLGKCAEIEVLSSAPGKPALISVVGELLPEDHKKFITKTLNFSDAIIFFDSPGGSIIAGVEIGKAIRLKNFATLVPSNTICASACALAWLGGTRRLKYPSGLIGFHAAYINSASGEAKESGVGNAIVGAYLNSLGLPMIAVAYITATSPESIQWLTFNDARKIGIEYAQLESSDNEVFVRFPISSAIAEKTTSKIPPLNEIRILSGNAPASEPGALALEKSLEGKPTASLSTYQILYSSALSANLDSATIAQIISIFVNALDLNTKGWHSGELELLLSEDEINQNKPNILFLKLTTGSETFVRYKFWSKTSLDSSYYDPDGVKTQRNLIRNPVPGSMPSSSFGPKKNPKNGKTFINTGVHWQAPSRSPVLSAGQGIVIMAGKDTSHDKDRPFPYGNRVEIQHSSGFITTYNNLSSIAMDLRLGLPVRLGQIIGQVGPTEFPSGTNLFYEVIVDGHFVDPMRVTLSERVALKDADLKNFQIERQRIDIMRSTKISTTSQ